MTEALLQVELLFESIYVLLFLAGIGLMVTEAMAPGTHVFVLGVGLLTAGIVGMLVQPVGLLATLFVAVAAIAATGVTLWGYEKTAMANNESVAETTDSQSLRGQFGTVTERVTAADGEVKLESGGLNPYYQARSTDGAIEEGAEVMVVDPGGGNVVTVEPVAGEDDIDRELARERARSDRPAGSATDDATGEQDVESDSA